MNGPTVEIDDYYKIQANRIFDAYKVAMRERDEARAERDAAEARGYQRAVDLVADALAKARAEPRRQPTDRTGRITALGSLLNDLMNLEQFEPTEGAQP